MGPKPHLLPLLSAAAGAVLVVLVAWASISGPVGATTSGGASAAATPSASPSGPVGATASHPRRLHGIRLPRPPGSYHYLGLWLLGGLALLGVMWCVGRSAPALLRAWRRRSDVHEHRDRPPPAPLAPVDPADAVRGDLDAQLTALAGGTPRNGVVAAWSRLEETTRASGVPRADWETPAEFTTRLLRSLDVDPLAAGRLAELYRRARFSSGAVTENDRAAAGEALAAIHRELA